MKTIKIISSLSILIGLTLTTSCKKSCEDEKPSACRDTLPSGQLCEAYFQSWFYNKSTKTCEYKGYSGCSPIGFQTEAECLACKCD